MLLKRLSVQLLSNCVANGQMISQTRTHTHFRLLSFWLSNLWSVASPPACKHLYLSICHLVAMFHVPISPSATRPRLDTRQSTVETDDGQKKHVSNFHSVVGRGVILIGPTNILLAHMHCHSECKSMYPLNSFRLSCIRILTKLAIDYSLNEKTQENKA